MIRLISIPTMRGEACSCKAWREMARRAPPKLACASASSRIRRRGEAEAGMRRGGREPQRDNGLDVNPAREHRRRRTTQASSILARWARHPMGRVTREGQEPMPPARKKNLRLAALLVALAASASLL